MFAQSKERIIRWWELAYLADEALGERFVRKAAAALPILEGGGASEIYSALDWRRMRLLQD